MNEEIINAQEQWHLRWLPNIESWTQKIKIWLREDTMNMVVRVLLDLTSCQRYSYTHEKNQTESTAFLSSTIQKASNGMILKKF